MAFKDGKNLNFRGVLVNVGRNIGTWQNGVNHALDRVLRFMKEIVGPQTRRL